MQEISGEERRLPLHLTRPVKFGTVNFSKWNTKQLISAFNGKLGGCPELKQEFRIRKLARKQKNTFP